jgi:ABC-type multidrug transport system fused ATPase/permease subunit
MGTSDRGNRLEPKQPTLVYLTRGLRTLWRLVETERAGILRALLYLLTVECLALVVPIVFKELLDLLPSIREQGISIRWYGLIGALIISSVALLSIRRFLQEPAFLRAIISLENHWPTIAHEKLLALSIGYHERENTGRKVAKVSKGVEKLVSLLGDFFWTLLPALFIIVLDLAVMSIMDWRLALIFAIPLIPAFWISLIIHERFYPSWMEWERRKEESVGLFCQSIVNIRTVQSCVAEEREGNTHANVRENMRDIDLRITLRQQILFFGMELLLKSSFVGTLVAGFHFVYYGWSTAGTIAYIAITGNAIQQSLWSVVQVYTRMLRDLVSTERMQTLLDEPIETGNIHKGVIPQTGHGMLAFKHVTLRYPGKDAPAFDRFDLAIEPGSMTAFVGRSGSGKSTLVRLLLRVYDPTDGAVTIDDIDVRTVDRDWYRARFAYVPQEVDIFDGTIRENITYAHPHATAQMIDEALEAACLSEALSNRQRFPDGIATEVGERGVRLSGGERQRVGIARAYIALLSGATTLVLDEATSSLDSESELVVQKFIERLRVKRAITIAVIAHRLSTISAADRICVLEDGQIVEQGSHEQLLRTNGIYHRLVVLQRLGELRA